MRRVPRGWCIRPGTQTCLSASWPAWPPPPGWLSRGPQWRCWSGARQKGRFQSGSAVMLPPRAWGPVLGWGAGWWAGCTGVGAWRASSADTVSGGRPRCTRAGAPAQDSRRDRQGGPRIRRKVETHDTSAGALGKGLRGKHTLLSRYKIWSQSA